MSALPNRLARLEFKYLIDEATAGRVCQELKPYCSLDAHARQSTPSPASGYRVRSLYLDTPAFAFHRAKERGDPERFKLRVRGYDTCQVLYLEIKHRSADFVRKQRIGCARFGVTADAIIRSKMERVLLVAIGVKAHFTHAINIERCRAIHQFGERDQFAIAIHLLCLGVVQQSVGGLHLAQGKQGL